MATNIPITSDTLITVKVAIDGTNRRFKLPLKDLGASTLPVKLRHHLGIAPGQVVVFERYSDSAAAYIRLDSDNPSVYKQLYRAAKAKLKLRLRATLSPPVPDLGAEGNKSIPIREQNPVNATGVHMASTLSNPPVRPVTLPAEPLSLPKSMPSHHSALAAILTQPPGSAFRRQSPALLDESLPSMKQELKNETPEALTGYPPSHVANVHIIPTTTQPPYSVYCNACDKPIPNEHYHCSICDAGDFDLCPGCVESGIVCGGEDHWLIKRFVNYGTVVNSTTETIAPKAKSANLPEKETVLQSVPCPAPQENEGNEWDTRTCNCCVTVYPESEFVTCTDCDDYDLCLTCHTAVEHGHDPSHNFAPTTAGTKLDDLASILCAPGRNVRHFAICDGCEKHIYGVRHKCLNCPDWDYCSTCVKSARQDHPGHRFVPIYEPLSIAPRLQSKHFGIYCDGPLCKSKGHSSQFCISGERYKCAVCPNTDFCAACEASPLNRHNPTHPLIKLKTPVRNVSVTTLGERDNGKEMPIMGDLLVPTRSVSTETMPAAKLANAATQVHTVADLQPTVEDVETVEQSSPKEPEPVELNAHFLRDTVPDGSMLPQNCLFEQTWTLRNPGPVSWPAGCSVRFVGGDSMLNIDSNHPSSVTDLANATESNVIGRVVEVGESVDFTVLLRSPQREGKAISYWRLTSADGVKFGHKLWCDIDVCQSQREVSSNAEHIENVAEESDKEDVETPKQENEDSEQSATEGSAMIFPKLEKESPVSSIQLSGDKPDEHSAAEANDDGRSLVEDLESLELEEDESEGGFLTDEEYDILDASDEDIISQGHKDSRV